MRPSRSKPTAGFVDAENRLIQDATGKHRYFATVLEDVLSTRTRLVRHRLTYADFRAGLLCRCQGRKIDDTRASEAGLIAPVSRALEHAFDGLA
jgi:hypothetical protein